MTEGAPPRFADGPADEFSSDNPVSADRDSEGEPETGPATGAETDGDERPDLWLWRVEPISVGDLFIWLALSGSINVEAFVYRNDGERFASRPARKITVALKFPSAVRVLTSEIE